MWPTGEPAPGARIEGRVVSDDAAQGTITMQVTGADGFLPSRATMNVATDSSTHFLDAQGKAESAASFFASLHAGTMIATFGSISDGTIEPRSLKVFTGS